MANTVTITGELTAGQQLACDSGFPAGLLQIKFGLSGGCPGTKAAPVHTYHTPNVNSSAAFVPLDGIGTGESVTKVNTLYIRSPGSMLLRLTTDDGLGGNVVSVVPLQGLGIWEYPSNLFLKLLEIRGVGQVEYYASGNE